MLHKESVETETLDLIYKLINDPKLHKFNLVGGTALSLMIGHRKSIDIDLFTAGSFNAVALSQHISKSYSVDLLNQAGNNIWCVIDGVKVDLIPHNYPLLRPVEVIEGIRMLSMEDISAMKVHAIFQNGSRLKDFVDIYFMLEKLPFDSIAKGFAQKYPHVNTDLAGRAILYHKDIDHTLNVDFLRKTISFSEIAARLHEAVQFPLRIFNEAVNKEKLQGSKRFNKGRRRSV